MLPLPDELLEEVFLRLPPDEPSCLMRASLANKLWLALVNSPGFRSRYIEFHGAPPMLEFLLSWRPNSQEKHRATQFVSTANFGAHMPGKSDWGQKEYDSLDCRHGRILLANTSVLFSKLAVWDPMTGCRRLLDAPDECFGLGAAVLCAVTGCDHRACHDGPFQVLLFGLSTNYGGGSVHAWLCSSEAEQWTEPCSPLQLGSVQVLIQPRTSLLFENALYNTVVYPDHIAILKYDIASNYMSLIDGPPLPRAAQLPILMAMEDDSVGFTYFVCFTLYRLSRHIRADEITTWSQRMVVDLKDILPFRNPKNEFRLVGFKKDDSGTIFVTTDLGIYEINLKSLEWKKLWKRENIRALIPYMSFYHPPDSDQPL